jgi:hypothetical protein
VLGDDPAVLAVLAGHVHGDAPGGVAEEPAHGAGEVAGVGQTLEADQVGAEQAVEDLLAPGQLGEDAVRREGNVVEEADHEVGARVAEHPRHQLELVVVHPHGGAGRCGGGGGLREPAVDLDVRLPPLAVVAGRRDDVVVQRPQGVVGEALVVELEVFCAQGHRHDGDAVVLERFELPVGHTGPAHPGAVRGAHHRFQRGDEATGRRAPAVTAVLGLLVVDG